ncbi:PCI domain-containing protein [Toxoplasma gondii RUB]|uniref:PCI domain-containing protein n=12 Tax=Toxoplasma gondii TaxID=5811 RepID=B9PN16_TOXGV|nr:PCI domain-containing protein [Toxoplasma gondii GT1]ESS32740.1 PCI domain-containing protein [Toxoplasma gondii VEG]KAF4640801.1 PCI domain-containing protein [Toxoplasma gondii]KFG42051.1 PCI domain-containing protein [Toxoplasma gondii p89]KFG45050.1 PCI domain-containing protein [Toxoplasma gondii GAB2-2007-GAL-DOM2]KFG52094.1 PCI domain-containing protein [Toxoplasma gondii FOU]KFG65639.1 PCI domain-containing protein [Toxoplasma gondii RUB]KFH10249.1 PCI domain-containing protein [T
MPPSAQPSETPEAPPEEKRGETGKAENSVAALLKKGQDLVGADPQKAIALIEEANRLAYQCAVKDPQVEKRPLPPPSVEEAMRLQEQGIALLASLYASQGDCESLQQLMRSSLPFFSLLAKARTAKLVRILVDAVAELPGAEHALVELCKEVIPWCQGEKRTFLRHRVEIRLAQVYVQLGMLQQAQPVLQQLLQEVKKLDDKLLLVEIHLIESRLQFKVKNYPKARAALTASRTNANAIHCPPLLQGDIDLQAGILAAQDRDYKTAFSYFFEAFDAFSAQDAAHHSQRPPSAAGAAVAAAAKGTATPGPSRALQALKYMLLSKILQGKEEEVSSLLTGKQGLRYYSMDAASASNRQAGAAASNTRRDLEAMRELALCHKQRSLKKFEEVLHEFSTELEGDEVLMHHIDELYENLLEKNLLQLLRPFSRVELAHVAQLIGLPGPKVEEKLSAMILDGKLHGTLDQGVGVLLLFEEQVLPEMHLDALATIKNMAQVVDTLYEKSLQAL